MKRIALLAHTLGNIGHTFMSDGFTNILKRYFLENGYVYKIDLFQQHIPTSVYFPVFSGKISYPIIGPGKMKQVKKIIFSKSILSSCLTKITSQRISKYDLAISIGGPNLVKGCSSSFDMKLMLHDMLRVFYENNIPVLNISNGACFPWESSDRILNEEDVEFWNKVIKYSDVVTVRDIVAQEILEKQCKYVAKVVPCPAICLNDVMKNDLEKEKMVVVNYQERGANSDWGQNVDKNLYRNVLVSVLNSFKKNYKIIFICHNKYEYNLAMNLKIDGAVYLPSSVSEYLSIISKAEFAIANRLHAGIALASSFIPTLVIGTDTRLYTAKEIGLPIVFVKELTDSEKFKQILSELLKSKELIIENCHKAKLRAYNEYISLIEKFI
jgi:polysaccharide pyruvyl transferase WcaK-like protein